MLDILKKYNQEQLLKFYDELSGDDKKSLMSQIEGINFEKVMKLFNDVSATEESENDEFSPVSYVERDKLSSEIRKEYEAIGNKIISEGGYAAVTMAGGQGTRLGHNGPKGTYDIGLPSHKSLFEIQCDRLSYRSKVCGKTIPWYIMTSKENDAETRAFFEAHNYFGYPKEDIKFFIQNMLPMVSFDGKIVLDEKGHVKEGADGHGGVFAALLSNGCYEDMLKRGVKWIFIGGIDNVLLRFADPEFIGFAEKSGMKIASKTLVKRDAKEGVGVFCKKNGKPYVVEYTEISEEMANAVDENGAFVYGDSHVLSNLFSIDALKLIFEGGHEGLPYHVAKKKTQFVDENGNIVKPEKPNAYKFEAFIFDAFTYFDDIALLRVDRESEFAPVKNKEGSDSPETAKAMFLECLKTGNVY